MPVERLALGDAVYTFDGGLAPIANLRQTRLNAGTQLWHVPGGALNNCSDLYLTQDQHVMIFDDNAEDLYDTPYVLVPATALQGFRGTRQMDCLPGTIAVEMTFDADEVVFANTGTLIRCAAQSGKGDGFFRTLTNAEARILLAPAGHRRNRTSARSGRLKIRSRITAAPPFRGGHGARVDGQFCANYKRLTC